MKTPTLQDDEIGSIFPGRREILKAATIGAGLALLPGARVFSAVVSPTARPAISMAPSVAMGYWKHQSGVAAVTTRDDMVADALSITPSSATYELRILGVNTNVPLAIDALYPLGAQHRFWQAWTEQKMLQHSPSSTIRWWANDKAPLSLAVQVGGGVGMTQVTAQAGTYVLAVGPNAQAIPAWSSLALRQNNNMVLQLVSRASGSAVAFPYAVFSVQPIVA
jgi:hypothetical protein